MFSKFRKWCAKQQEKCTFSRCTRTKTASFECGYNEQASSSHGRRLGLGRFVSERNIHEQVEQQMLKHLLKERGLYSKNQTLEQRRKLKHLLELEQRAFLARRGAVFFDNAQEPDSLERTQIEISQPAMVENSQSHSSYAEESSEENVRHSYPKGDHTAVYTACPVGHTQSLSMLDEVCKRQPTPTTMRFSHPAIPLFSSKITVHAPYEMESSPAFSAKRMRIGTWKETSV